jgi:UPF0716 protein FxsA
MRFLIPAVVIGLPILDIASLIEAGSHFGLLATLAGVALSAVAGTIMMRTQGFAIVSQANAVLSEGKFPVREVFDGSCVMLGGLMLVFPGFISDVFGLLLLAPPVRKVLRGFLASHVQNAQTSGVWVWRGARAPDARTVGPVVDGECEPVSQADASELANDSESVARNADESASPWRKSGSAAVVPYNDT